MDTASTMAESAGPGGGPALIQNIHLDREALAALLLGNMNATSEWFTLQPDSRFTFAPAGKWSAGQHLDHLLKSTKPVLLALRLPRLVPRLLFGTAKRPGETNAIIVGKYQKVLQDGGKASGPFIPPGVGEADKARLIGSYRKLSGKLAAAVRVYPEAALDTLVLPHPLLGKLTLREMLYFTAYHTAHHLETLRKHYED
ncbi:MAG: DinB family protein [Candidatus Hydrogenedentes bacterium]|nr:DinB family protein [Candidatus Hydrogenedentota bacterium]